jgi:hypothetical protein
MKPRKKTKRSILVAVCFAYTITWLGGHYTHRKNLASQALALYNAAQKRNAEMSAFAREEGLADQQPIKLREGGPQSEVKWSFPLLPGIIVANSYYVNGPLYAEGGTKMILYYGVSSTVICKLTKWVS